MKMLNSFVFLLTLSCSREVDIKKDKLTKIQLCVCANYLLNYIYLRILDYQH